MKLCILPVFVSLFGLVSLTSARFLPFNAYPMMRSNALRYAAGSRPMSVIEGESFNGGVGEENFNHGLGGGVFNIPLRSLTRSIRPQYGSSMDAAEVGYQLESDAIPWGTY